MPLSLSSPRYSLTGRTTPHPNAPIHCNHPQLSPGSHVSEAAVNKQLNDKERVAAALENPALLSMVDRCLASSDGEGAANLGGGA